MVDTPRDKVQSGEFQLTHVVVVEPDVMRTQQRELPIPRDDQKQQTGRGGSVSQERRRSGFAGY